MSRSIGQRAGGGSRHMVTRALMATGMFALVASALFGAFGAGPAVAATGINKQINFQGKLVNTNGTNIPDGTYNIEFELYTGGTGCVSGGSSPCGGTLQWTEDHLRNTSTGVVVNDGIFQVNLGSVTSLPAIFNNDTIWLSINLGNTNATCTPFSSCAGDGEMLPFIRFTASPYALNSDLLDGLDSADFAQLNPGTAQSGSLNVTGSVQAATSLQAPLVDAATAVALNVGTGTASSVTVGRALSTTNLTLQGSAATTWKATGAGGSTTVGFTAPTGTNSIAFPDAGGTVCTTVASTCSSVYATTTGFLAKNAADTSSFAVTAAGYLYGFTNSSSAVASGVLKLDNGANTGNALYVTASANPGTGLLVVNNTNGAPSGNLVDLQTGGVSRFNVDAAGNVTQVGGTTTVDTVNGQRISAAANFTGTVTAATSVTVPLVKTADVASGTSADITVRSGNGTAGGASSGNVTIDSGSKNGAGFGGNVYVGNTNALNVTIGRNAATASGTSVSIQGLAATSSMIFNDSTNTNQTTLTVTTPTAARSISFPDANGAVCLDTGNCSGTNGYILNQTGVNQTANFQITGTGRANTSILTPLLDTPSGTTTLNIGTNNATAGINLNQNITVASGKTATFQGNVTQSNGAVSLTANGASSFTTSTGALTLTAGGTSVWSTSAGDLSVQAAANLNLGNGGGTAINIGTNASTHTIGIGTDNSTAQVLSLGSTNASTTLTVRAGALTETSASTGLTVKTGTNSATALELQNASGADIVRGDTTDTNLIVNPGAEVAFASDWSAYGSNTTVSRNTANAWSGAGAVGIVVTPSTGGVGARNALGAALTTSTQYTLSFYAKLKAGDPAFADVAAAYSRDGTSGTEVACASYNSQTVVSGGWTRVTCAFTTSGTAGNSSAYIVIRQTASAARTFYLDGVQLELTNNVANAYGAGTLAIDAVLNNPLALQNTEDSTTAFGVQNAAGVMQFAVDTLGSKVSVAGTLQANTLTPTAALTIGASTQSLSLLGTSASSLAVTNAGNTLTVDFATPTVNGSTYRFAAPTAGSTVYNICTSDVNSCTTYLRKGVEETDNVNVTAGNYILTLNNNGSGSSGGLSVNNGAGQGSSLSVTATANPSAGGALIYAKLTNASVGGNLLDLWSGATGAETSKLAVDAAGNITQAGGTSTTDTINGQRISSAASFSGTVTAATGLTVTAGGAAIGGNSSVTGTLGVSSLLSLTGTGGNELNLSGTPGSSSLVLMGSALTGGSASGTYVGINQPAAATADFLNFQVNGVYKLKVSSAGLLDAIGGFAVNGTAGVSIGACAANEYVNGFQTNGGILTAGACAAIPGASSANQQLSNLSGTVAINLSLLSGSSSIDLGSTTHPFRDLYLGGASSNNFKFTGTATTGRTITLQDLTGTMAIVQATVGTAQTGYLNIGTEVDAPSFDVASAGALAVGTGTATSVSIGKSTTTTTNNGTFIVGGGGAGTGAYKNNGSTVNTVYSMGNLTSGGWDAGGAAATVDIYTYIAAGQTSASQTLTPPTPTANTTYGRVIYLSNTGTASFTILGTVMSAGSTATLVWANVNGVGTWTLAGADGSGILNQSTSDQTANFRISGTGRANTSFTAPLYDTITASQLNLGTSTSNAVSIGKTANTTTINGSTTVGTAASGNLFKNNGATQNVACTYSAAGNITLNTAGKTVDDCTAFTITVTSGSPVVTVPSPAAGDGALVYITNKSTSTSAITVSGTAIGIGATATLVYNNAAWTFAGQDANGLQSAYNNSGTTDPQIQLSNTNGGLKIRDAGSSTITNLLQIANSGATVNYLTVTSAASTFGGNIGFSSTGTAGTRTISVATQTASNTAGDALGVTSAAGLGSGVGGALALAAGAGGTTGVGGAITITGGAAGGGNTNGGAATITSGAPTGTGTGGTLSLISAAGAAAGTVTSAGGVGGAMLIQGGNGGAGGATSGNGGNASDITVQAGNGGNAISGANGNGGSIRLTAGNAGAGAGTAGTPGAIFIDSPVFTSNTQTFTQTSNNQAFPAAGAETTTLQNNVDGYGTLIFTVSGAFNGATVTIPSPGNTSAGHLLYILAGTGSASFTLASTNMPSFTVAAGDTATLVWTGSNWTAGIAASSLQQVYNATTSAPASIVTTSSTKNLLFQAGSGFDNANLFQVGNSLGAQALTVDTTNTADSTNLAQNSGAETAGPAGWTAFAGSGTPVVSRDTTAGEYASGTASVKVNYATAISGGVDNALNSTALATAATAYNVTFSVKAATSAPSNANMVVEYYRATGTLDATCATAPSPAITTTAFSKFQCTFTSTGNTKATSNFLRIRTADAVARSLFIDNLALVAVTTGTQNMGNIQVGGINSQGLTLMTLDSYASNPFTGLSNTALLGSMYYDTTAGRIQCYEADGWGSCGASPNNQVTLTAEYTGAVLNGSGTNNTGTMTANLCSGPSRLSINPDASLCATTEEYSYYRWTTTQSANAQSYDVYVRYQLPTTFKSFLATPALTARTTDFTNGPVTITLYGASQNTACGSAASSSNNTWQTLTPSVGTCTFAAGDMIMMKINMAAKSSSISYSSNITFTNTGK